MKLPLIAVLLLTCATSFAQSGEPVCPPEPEIPWCPPPPREPIVTKDLWL